MIAQKLIPLVALISAGVCQAQIKPGKPVDVSQLVMDVGKWQAGNHDFNLVPWEGKNVVFLTMSEDLDQKAIGEFVGYLDQGWALFEKLTGKKPQPLKQINGKATIIALPADNLTCGYGCGFVGATGIEMTDFYSNQYNAIKKNPKSVPHCYFYEMGRNYYVFGQKHNAFVTGFAVFMRYVCIDTIKLHDIEEDHRKLIEKVIKVYEKSDVPFLEAFTMPFNNGNEKHARFDGYPSDQPVMYTAAMLALYKELGNEWLERFFKEVSDLPDYDGNTKTGARNQCIGWYLAASCAAGKDLGPYFIDKWRLEIPDKGKEMLKKIDWRRKPKASQLVKVLLNTGGFPKEVE
jgi:hypothetical protein